MEIAYIIGTILSGLAAVLAWLAKLFWSKEYISAKDEIINAKKAHIEQLESQVQHYKDLTPMKIREYFQSVKEQLEEYNETLQNNLEQTKDKLAKKTEEIKKFEQNDQRKSSDLDKIKGDKEKLEEQVKELEAELAKLRINEEEFNTIRIPKIDTSALVKAARAASESMNESLGNLANLSKSMESLKGLAPPIPLNSREEVDMALWFVERYEDPAENVPYDSKEGGYQYFADEPYDAREVISEQFSDTDENLIDSVVEYLESLSPVWVRKDRMS